MLGRDHAPGCNGREAERLPESIHMNGPDSTANGGPGANALHVDVKFFIFSEQRDTVPLAVPPTATVTANRGEEYSAKTPVTVVLAVMVTVHVPIPAQPPPVHPVNTDPAAATGVRVALVSF